MERSRKRFQKSDSQKSEAAQHLKQSRSVTIPPDSKGPPDDINGLCKRDVDIHIENVVAKYCANINEITWLTPISATLKNLYLSGTVIDDWNGLSELTRLHVLDLSNCKLKKVPSGVSKLNELLALILTNNELTSISEKVLRDKPQLNTLVISHNPQLQSLPSNLAELVPSLVKLSSSHTDFTTASLPDLTECCLLRQVRLNDNRNLKSLPPHFATWGRDHSSDDDGNFRGNLRLLALSGCGIEDWSDIQYLAGHNDLENLSLSRNPVSESDRATDENAYKKKLSSLFPKLKVIDERRLEGVDKKQKKTIKEKESLSDRANLAPKAGEENETPNESRQRNDSTQTAKIEKLRKRKRTTEGEESEDQQNDLVRYTESGKSSKREKEFKNNVQGHYTKKSNEDHHGMSSNISKEVGKRTDTSKKSRNDQNSKNGPKTVGGSLSANPNQTKASKTIEKKEYPVNKSVGASQKEHLSDNGHLQSSAGKVTSVVKVVDVKRKGKPSETSSTALDALFSNKQNADSFASW